MFIVGIGVDCPDAPHKGHIFVVRAGVQMCEPTEADAQAVRSAVEKSGGRDVAVFSWWPTTGLHPLTEADALCGSTLAWAASFGKHELKLLDAILGAMEAGLDGADVRHKAVNTAAPAQEGPNHVGG